MKQKYKTDHGNVPNSSDDWLRENDLNTNLNGFKWKHGGVAETKGIWMWGDVFTYDFPGPNGKKVAIILLDTQGVFDLGKPNDYIMIFALSTMVSSTQCYNLMQNLESHHFDDLKGFTQYGMFALNKTNETPFQNLFFIVRDFRFAMNNPYGLEGGQQEIDAKLSNLSVSNPELFRGIKASFTKINATLLPMPGDAVYHGRFTGKINEIDSEFLKYVKEFVPMIFAPENLVVKKINGAPVNAHEFAIYLENYVNVLKTAPEPQSWSQVWTIFKIFTKFRSACRSN